MTTTCAGRFTPCASVEVENSTCETGAAAARRACPRRVDGGSCRPRSGRGPAWMSLAVNSVSTRLRSPGPSAAWCHLAPGISRGLGESADCCGARHCPAARGRQPARSQGERTQCRGGRSAREAGSRSGPPPAAAGRSAPAWSRTGAARPAPAAAASPPASPRRPPPPCATCASAEPHGWGGSGVGLCSEHVATTL